MLRICEVPQSSPRLAGQGQKQSSDGVVWTAYDFRQRFPSARVYMPPTLFFCGSFAGRILEMASYCTPKAGVNAEGCCWPQKLEGGQALASTWQCQRSIRSKGGLMACAQRQSRLTGYGDAVRCCSLLLVRCNPCMELCRRLKWLVRRCRRFQTHTSHYLHKILRLPVRFRAAVHNGLGKLGWSPSPGSVTATEYG
jgi:hypothetical protein